MTRSAQIALPMDRYDALEATSERRAVTFDDILAFRETVFRICLGFSRDYAEAEDLAQDVYVRAFRGLANLQNPIQAREWLFRIAKNACLDFLKTGRKRTALLRRWADGAKTEDAPRPSDPSDDLRIRLKAAVRGLPKKLREVFVLQAYGRLTYDEIAAALRLPRGTVMSRLNRARARLARIIEEKRP